MKKPNFKHKLLAPSGLLEFEVRDYELDAQGIVNNARYLHYFEHARHKYLLSLGIDIQRQSYDPVVIHIDIAYKKPLYSQDEFVVKTEFYQVSKLKFLFEQQIYLQSNNLIICEGATTVTCLDKTTHRPVIAENLLEIFK